MPGKYIFDRKGYPVPCDDTLRWAYFMEVADRKVARDSGKTWIVSTVFLGLDHSFDMGGPPVLFETLVFGNPLEDFMLRYNHRGAALKGHAAVVKGVSRYYRPSIHKLRYVIKTFFTSVFQRDWRRLKDLWREAVVSEISNLSGIG